GDVVEGRHADPRRLEDAATARFSKLSGGLARARRGRRPHRARRPHVVERRMSFVRTFGDAAAVSRAAARDVVELAGDAIVARGRFTVALPSGSPPARRTSGLGGGPLG